MLKEKYGKWVLVLGATDGVGKAFCNHFAKEGMSIVLVGRRVDKMEYLGKSLQDTYGIEYRIIGQDLSTEDAADNIISKCSDIEISVFNYVACAIATGSFLSNPLETHMAVLNVNIVNFVKMLHHFGNKMKERRNGAMVIVSSLSGFFGNPYNANYSASKAYITNLCNALWYELKEYNVDVLTMILGATATPTYFMNNANEDEGSIKMTPEEAVEEGMPYLSKQMEIIVGEHNKQGYEYMTKVMPKEDAIANFAKPFAYKG